MEKIDAFVGSPQVEETKPNVKMFCGDVRSRLYAYTLGDDIIYMIPPNYLLKTSIEKDLAGYEIIFLSILTSEEFYDDPEKALDDFGFKKIDEFREIKEISFSEDRKMVTMTYEGEGESEIVSIDDIVDPMIKEIRVDDDDHVRLICVEGVEFIIPLNKQLYFPYLLDAPRS